MTKFLSFFTGALLYRQDGSNESAAQLLEKACKIVIRVIYFRSILLDV